MTVNKPHQARRLDFRRERLYRLITSPMRVLPDFIIIGTQKGGTTSLFRYLVERAPVLPSLVKEVHYFDLNFGKGAHWYKANFPLQLYKHYIAARNRHNYVAGEACPYYMVHPRVPGRVSKLLPRVKVIALLRNPADRALSHYHHQIRGGRETLSFEAALEAEPTRLKGEADKIRTDDNYVSEAYRRFSYLARGIYVEQLKSWQNHIDPEQMLILKSEDLFDRPAEVFQEVVRFLNISGGKTLPFKKFNAGHYDPMTAATRHRLTAYFEPYNQQLYELLGRDFGWET